MDKLIRWVSIARVFARWSNRAVAADRADEVAVPRGSGESLLDRPGAIFWLLVALLPLFVILSLVVPPFDDELYYWCWSRDLQFSYYDHPAMVAYMIRLSTALFGHSILAIRVPSIIAALIVIGVVTRLSRPRDLIPYIILSPVPTFAAVMITPDVPMLQFWALYLAWLVFAHKRLPSSTGIEPEKKLLTWHWVLGGAILGCGVLGKYTTGLAAISGFFSFAFAGCWRRWIVGYTLHGVVALIVASPILIHNIQYDFAPILYQWEHTMSSPEPGFSSCLEFVGIQLLFFGSIPFFAFGWGLIRFRELIADPRLRACTCLFVFPFGFFLYKSTQGRLEGNWPFPCYIACWPLAAELYRRLKWSRAVRVLTPIGFAVPLGTSFFFAVHAVVPLPFVPVEDDRATRQWDKMALVQAVAADLRASGYTGPVYATTYQWVSLLRWYGVDARQQEGVSRPSHFTERKNPPIDPTRYVLFLETVTPVPEEKWSDYNTYRLLSTHQLFVRDEPGPYFHLLDYSVPK